MLVTLKGLKLAASLDSVDFAELLEHLSNLSIKDFCVYIENKCYYDSRIFRFQIYEFLSKKPEFAHVIDYAPFHDFATDIFNTLIELGFIVSVVDKGDGLYRVNDEI